MIQGKVWGSTRKLFARNNVEIHRIEAKQWRTCSKHRHAHKVNVFFVERGLLAVDVWKKDYPLVDRTLLGPGESTAVKAGEYHRFVAYEDTVAFEIYYVELDENDIERETCGGAVEQCDETPPNR